MTSAVGTVARWRRAIPALLRIGLAETIAYRVEWLIWMLTTTLPLVMLALWTSVAAEGPFKEFGEREFVAYYLATLVVRNLTGNWAVWQINEDIRTGELMQRLLRPIHPLVTYATTHLSALPLRALFAVPLSIILLATSAREIVIRDPGRIAIFVAMLAGGFLLTYLVHALIGSLGFFLEKSTAVFELYLGLFTVLSGYLIPLVLLPGWVGDIAAVMPMRYMLAVPVETLIGMHTPTKCLELLGLQWAFIAFFLPLTLWVWRLGVRRFEAFGS